MWIRVGLIPPALAPDRRALWVLRRHVCVQKLERGGPRLCTLLRVHERDVRAMFGARVLLAGRGKAQEADLALVAPRAWVSERVAQLSDLLPCVRALRKWVGAHVGLQHLAVARTLGSKFGKPASAQLCVQLAPDNGARIQENAPVC